MIIAMTPEDQTKHLIENSDKNLEMHQHTKNISYEALRKIIFVVSTGTFVLSINLIGYLDSELYYVWLLVIAWVLEVLTILAYAFGHLLQIKESTQQFRLLNKERMFGFKSGSKFDSEIVPNDPELNKLKNWRKVVSVLTSITFVAGILCLLLFVSTNLLMQQKVKKVKSAEEKAKLEREIIMDTLQKELIIRQIANPKRHH